MSLRLLSLRRHLNVRVTKVLINFAENSSNKKIAAGEPDGAIGEKDASESSVEALGVKVYQRKKLSRKIYGRVLKKNTEAEEGTAALISEGAGTF